MLLMPGDKKRVASVIVADIKPDFVGKEKGGYDKEFDHSEDGDEESSEADPGLEACAEACIKCFKSGDAAGLASALKDFVEMCSGGE